MRMTSRTPLDPPRVWSRSSCPTLLHSSTICSIAVNEINSSPYAARITSKSRSWRWVASGTSTLTSRSSSLASHNPSPSARSDHPAFASSKRVRSEFEASSKKFSRNARRGYDVLTTDPSDAGSAGILSRRTDRRGRQKVATLTRQRRVGDRSGVTTCDAFP
eukprot:958708-Prorocentrum_minimum.AAC.1